MFVRAFIYLVLLVSLTVTASAATTRYFGSDITLSYVGVLLLITGIIATLFYPILMRSFRVVTPKPERTPLECKEIEHLKAQLTASMSHELRTPLNSIIGFTGIILQGMSGEINRRQRDQLERVLASAKRLLGMISDVIDIAKIDSCSARFHPTNILLAETLQESINNLRRELPHIINNIDIKVDISHEFEVCTDKKKLTQSILNILVYIVECANIENITITASKAGQFAIITIGTANPVPDQRILEHITSSMHCLEPVSGEQTSNNIRMHLTKKLVANLPGGDLIPCSGDENGALLYLKFHTKL